VAACKDIGNRCGNALRLSAERMLLLLKKGAVNVWEDLSSESTGRELSNESSPQSRAK